MKRKIAVWVALVVLGVAVPLVAATFGPNSDSYINGRWRFGQSVNVAGLEVQPMNNQYKVTFSATPTANRTVTIPDGTGTVTLYKRLTHDYGALSASWTLTANEAVGLMLSTTNLGAGGGGDIVAPNDPGKMFIVVNGSGQTHSIKVLGQTGVAIANGKTAIVACNGTDYVRVTADNP